MSPVNSRSVSGATVGLGEATGARVAGVSEAAGVADGAGVAVEAGAGLAEAAVTARVLSSAVGVGAGAVGAGGAAGCAQAASQSATHTRSKLRKLAAYHADGLIEQSLQGFLACVQARRQRQPGLHGGQRLQLLILLKLHTAQGFPAGGARLLLAQLGEQINRLLIALGGLVQVTGTVVGVGLVGDGLRLAQAVAGGGKHLWRAVHGGQGAGPILLGQPHDAQVVARLGRLERLALGVIGAGRLREPLGGFGVLVLAEEGQALFFELSWSRHVVTLRR